MALSSVAAFFCSYLLMYVSYCDCSENFKIENYCTLPQVPNLNVIATVNRTTGQINDLQVFLAKENSFYPANTTLFFNCTNGHAPDKSAITCHRAKNSTGNPEWDGAHPICGAPYSETWWIVAICMTCIMVFFMLSVAAVFFIMHTHKSGSSQPSVPRIRFPVPTIAKVNRIIYETQFNSSAYTEFNETQNPSESINEVTIEESSSHSTVVPKQLYAFVTPKSERNVVERVNPFNNSETCDPQSDNFDKNPK